MYVLDLSEISQADASLVGSKAFRLAELMRVGLPVPDGFCLTTMAFEAFLAYNGLQSGAFIGPEAICAADLPPPVVRALERGYALLGPNTPVAVRSSATAEDLEGASFAGQYDSFLNVIGAASLADHVRACWAGLRSERALAYLERHGLAPQSVAMGVLVQRQVAAQAAGVLFTLNPLTGREEEMMVEAVRGLGEAAVSGQQSPDTYVVHADTGRLLNRHLSRQETMSVLDPEGGLRKIPVPAEWEGQPVLDDDPLAQLIDFGHRVQSVFGCPQDVEWALVGGDYTLLQSRPLTSVNFDVSLGQWTSANYREVLPGLPSPLSMSMSLEHDYGRALSEFFCTLKMGESPPGTVWGRPFFGRPYWNVAEAKRFAAIIPGYKERTFDRTVGIEPTYEGDGQTTAWTPCKVVRALPVLLALNQQYRIGWQWAQEYRDRFLGEEEPVLDDVDPATLSDEELASWLPRIFELHWQANGTAIKVSLLSTQSQDDFEPMVRRLNAQLPGDHQIAEGDLITGLSEVGTAQPTLELWNLACQARADTCIAAAITACEAQDIPARLLSIETGRGFLSEVKRFISRYRHMAPVDEDLAQPRWDEDPTFVWTMLQGYVRVGDDLDPHRHLAEQQHVRREAERRVLEALSRGWRRFWPSGRRSFLKQLALVRRYVWWREELRVISAKAFYHCRRFFLELGRRWAARGLLSEPNEIFLLRWAAIKARLKGQLDREGLRRQIERYRRLRNNYRDFEPPSVIGVGSGALTGASRSSQRCFQGIPCSSGQAVGPARVARRLVEAQALQHGEILVATYTNPGWTPLFNLAAGIVIEEGGLLSHGAVVAREYGIPTVLRVEGATRLFRTGQWLAVDGGRGEVEIVRHEAGGEPT